LTPDEGEEDFEEDEGYLDGGMGEFEGLLQLIFIFTDYILNLLDIEDDVGFLPPRFTGVLGGRNGGIPPRFVPFDGRPDAFLGGYRSHRSGGVARPADDAMNPLLDRARQGNNDELRAPPRVDIGAIRPEDSAAVRGALEMVLPGVGSRLGGPDYTALIRSLAGSQVLPSLNSLIQVVEGGTNRSILPHLHPHHHHHHSHSHPHSAIQVSMPGVPGYDMFMAGHRHSPGRNARNDPVAAVDYDISKTLERWKEEANMLCPGPGQTTAKAAQVINTILRLLVPPAIRAEKARKEAADLARKEEEERQRKQAEQEEEERKERVAREQREAAEKAAEEAARQAHEAELAAQQAQESDAIMADVGEGGDANVAEPAATDNDADIPGAPALQARPRVVTNIHGREIDITHLGIDLEFLDALPEDMRDEVIMGRVAEQRSQAAAAGQEQSTFDQDFLAALPAEIREEVLQQEAADRRRRDREEARRRASGAGGGQARAEEMDPASFIATLDDPVLRQSLLAEADEDILALLPPDVAAEARALGGHHRRRGMNASGLLASMGLEASHDHPGRHHDRGAERQPAEPKPRRPIIQMLDKSGVATLLRLMFIRVQGSCRNSLNEILRNACGNHQTRGEIISGLLSVLQDGTVDAAALDRAFTQLATRAIQPASVSKTPQSVKKTASKPALDPAETTPMVVMDHCLNALIFLTSTISHVPKFFLTEHEALISAKVKGKGKGKAKDNKAGRYPINSLFLILEREEVVDNPALMELLSSLLQMLTVPLTTLLKKDKADAPKAVEPAAASSSNGTTTFAPDGTTDTPTEFTVPAEPVEPSETSAAAAPKVEDKKKELVPPEIPEKSLRALVNILTARECSGKTFRDTLSTINNLCAIPGARQIFGQELIKRARSLAASIQGDLAKLIHALKGAEDEMEAQTLALANFSPAGSDQAKLNRVLTALDYLFDTRSADNKKQSESALETGTELVAGLYEDPSFSKLWHQLGDCLSATQQAEKYFLNVATILLPLIESLMVVCKGLTLRDARPLTTKASLPTTPAPEPAMKNVFFTFTNRHKKILNDLVRQNPKLMSGSFSVLVKNPGVLEFDNKRNYFNRRLHYKTAEQRAAAYPPLQLNIRRPLVFGDSYRSLFFKKPEEIKYGKLNIRFHGEEGVDAGGVTREWFQVLARQMFNADNALFNPVASDRTTFHPNNLSSVNEDHLKYFHFIGRIIGKALYENRVLDCHFSRAVYKRILGKQVSLKDMETIDLEYTKSLRWMLENDITDIITETFSFDKDNFGSIEVIDLIENGRNVPVTEENKQEYVRLVTEYKLTGSVDEQLRHFLKGFHDIVPAELISIFDEGELELLISGMPEIDVDDWKNNTDYVSYTNASPQIQWFWRAVRSFDKEEQAKLLQFITGTGKVPLNGFKELEGMNGFTRFSIHKDFGDKNRLPSSHTCFNRKSINLHIPASY
jgi:E3 ubiquitin-protein ligase HUWE1